MKNQSLYENLFERLVSGEEKLALIGLGYVGMPIAVEFAKHVKVIGFNHNERRVLQYMSGIDPTHEVGTRPSAQRLWISQRTRPACAKHGF